DLRETARSAIEALSPFLAEHDTRLTVDIADEPILVLGDAARLQQIQANLLSNASKYSPRDSDVRFELFREGEQAVIRITDRSTCAATAPARAACSRCGCPWPVPRRTRAP